MSADEVVKGLQYLSGVLRARVWHKARERKKEFVTTCSEAAALIENLQKQLAESQRRERAAVELIPRECRTCAHWDKSKGKPYGCKLGGCVSLNRPEQWQWRGPQDEEGENT